MSLATHALLPTRSHEGEFHVRPYRRPLGIAALLFALLLAACSSGGGGDATEAPGGSDPAPVATDAPSDATTVPTETPTEEPAASGPFSPYLDGENDCQRNSDYAEAPTCMAPDIESVTVSRSSPVTVVVVFRAPPTATDWQLTLGFDLDLDPTTGINEGIWTDVHGIGPDIEMDYFIRGGPDDALAQSYQVDPGPTYNLVEIGPPGDGPMIVWTWNDERTLQVVIQDTVIPDSATMFYVAGQTMQPDYHDPFPDPDDGPLAFGG